MHDLVAAAVFGETDPLGRPVIGTEQTIGALGVPDVDGYHRAMYVDRNVVVAAAGSVEHDALVELIGRHLAPLHKRTGRCSSATAGRARPARRAVQREGTEQFHVCLGAPGVSRSDDRRFAASLLDAIFGGTASSRLFQEIREQPRDGLLGLQLHLPLRRDRTGRGVPGDARREPPDLPAAGREQADELAAGRFADSRAAAGEGAPEGPDRALDGVDLGPHVPARKSLLTGVEILSVDEIVSRIDAVTPDEVAQLAGDLYGAGQLAAAGVGPDEARFDDAVQAAALQRRAA